MFRIAHVSWLTFTTACFLSSAACSSSNDPATPSGKGGSSSVAGSGNTSAGTSSTSAGTGNTLGGASNAGTGGSTSIAGNSGISGSTSIAGAGGAASGAAGGATSTAGAGGGYEPLCSAVPVTAGGVAPTKGGACTATDSQLCYKTCGPLSSGFKSETCTAGAYAEEKGCEFPVDADYSCFKVPTAVDATCPTTAPQASQPCTVAACTPCSAGGQYLDSTGVMKAGYCVCPAPGATGTSKWSCASTTSWPCPAGKGC